MLTITGGKAVSRAEHSREQWRCQQEEQLKDLEALGILTLDRDQTGEPAWDELSMIV